jgi:hypothetical protein
VVQGLPVAFALGEYDRSLPLVIAPVLAYSTFLGGSGDESGNGIVVDAAGDAFVTGTRFRRVRPAVVVKPVGAGGF